MEYFQVQPIENVSVRGDEDIRKVLWKRKRNSCVHMNHYRSYLIDLTQSRSAVFKDWKILIHQKNWKKDVNLLYSSMQWSERMCYIAVSWSSLWFVTKYGPEKLRIWALFTQWKSWSNEQHFRHECLRICGLLSNKEDSHLEVLFYKILKK